MVFLYLITKEDAFENATLRLTIHTPQTILIAKKALSTGAMKTEENGGSFMKKPVPPSIPGQEKTSKPQSGPEQAQEEDRFFLDENLMLPFQTWLKTGKTRLGQLTEEEKRKYWS